MEPPSRRNLVSVSEGKRGKEYGQHAIVQALVGRTREAAERANRDRIAIVGGVAANSALRAALPEATAAPLALCTDNAAMIASAARFARRLAYPEYLGLDAYATGELAR